MVGVASAPTSQQQTAAATSFVSSDRIRIFDTTLRDGEQSPGVHLNGEDKVQIGRALARLGVDVCEIGFPACAVDLPSIQKIVESVGNYTEGRPSGEPMTLAVLARCVKSDIDAAWEVVKPAKHPRIHVFLATSDIHLEFKLKKTRAQCLEIIHEMVSYARSKCTDVEFSAEDASRTTVEFLSEAFAVAAKAGATTLNIPDTVGTALPDTFGQFIADTRAALRTRIGDEAFSKLIFAAHCHNDLGVATANSLAGVKAGARQVEGTINGIGERAGNAALEEIIMAIQLHPTAWGVPHLHHNFNTKLIVPTSQLVSKLSGMAVQRNKAIVGANCCLHESGVHVDGILKNRSTYEIFRASDVGWPENSGIVLGKHSGKAAYKSRMTELGITFGSDAELQSAFQKFQTALTANKDQALSDEQLKQTGQAAQQQQVQHNKTVEIGNTINLVELQGDGINDEVLAEGKRVLNAVASAVGKTIQWQAHPIGGRAIDETGSALPDSTLAACKASHGVMLGAVGTPKYGPDSPVRPEQGLLKLRTELQVFANLRPVTVFPKLIDAAPFKKEVIDGADIMIVRELTGGIYMASHTQTATDATDIMYYTVAEIERIIRVAAKLSQQRSKKLISLDKANVLACSRLWRQVATRVIRDEFPDVTLEHQLIDSAAMLLCQKPKKFDVIVTENLFGDILSDEAAALAASLGMMGSASIGLPGAPGLFEPVHGSAPDIAGKNIANPIGTILAAAMLLRYGLNMPNEATIVEQAIKDVIDDGVATVDIAAKGVKSVSTQQMGQAIAERVSKLLSASRPAPQKSVSRRPSGIRAMTLPEKILCHQALGLNKAEVKVGDVIVVKVARTLASEMTWLGMSETWNHIGKPRIWRNDRFFLAVDHTVDPTNYEKPFQKSLITAAEKFAKESNLTDYFGPNTSILHTEFYRQRAVPGTVIIGADSHSCSAGCLGTWAAGMGAADVVMPVVTGQTFIQVPETLHINFKNDLPFGMSGKDVMLYILQKLKRNTVAFERAVEFSGSIKSLSVDSRFALSNMATEFGAIAGIFPSDEVTHQFLAGRKRDAAARRSNSKGTVEELKEGESPDAATGEGEPMNFHGDEDADYAERYDIDLHDITPLIAKWPSPDNVYSVDDPEIDAIVPEVNRSIRHLDGCFIGACTTTEEEMILAGLVLEVAMNEGQKPAPKGQRKISPGSAIMKEKLERIGILDIYRRAGYTIGAPGCAYCLAVNGVDVAAKGSVWLSSQNRNFRNRMGPGSIGNLASAATVAASSFEMTITDPRPLLAKVDRKRFEQLLEHAPMPQSVPIHEPQPELTVEGESIAALPAVKDQAKIASRTFAEIKGRVQRFEDNVDTDAIIPGQLMLERPLSKLGGYSFHHVRPEFVGRVKEGRTIVVAGVGFGSGSSREEAVSCLRAVGVQAVIAKSYAFIFGRNLLCLDLLGIIIKDERFYELAQENAEVTVDVEGSKVTVQGETFPFNLSEIQKQIYRGGGVVEMYRREGKDVFKNLAEYAKERLAGTAPGCGPKGESDCGTGAVNADLDLPEGSRTVIAAAKHDEKKRDW